MTERDAMERKFVFFVAMNFLTKLFNRNDSDIAVPDIKFGRFSDSYKSDKKYQLWDQALEKYEKEDYLVTYELFFDYLRDDELKNVITEKGDDWIKFNIYQGSKLIEGYIKDKKIFAEAKVAQTDGLEIGFLRRIIELNYKLKYCRYALDPSHNITVVFTASVLDSSPYKLYYALKELSTQADKQDDLLLDDFQSLRPINMGHIRDISEEEKQVKFRFVQTELEKALHTYDHGKLNKAMYPGGISYLLLSALYKIDYLTKPEGVTMDEIEKVHQLFFANNNEQVTKKNLDIASALREMQKITEADFHKEIYEVMSTFGITAPTSHEQFNTFAQNELPKMQWYADNNYTEIAISVPDYIVGYALYNFALPLPLKELLHLYFQITENAFFMKLGYKENFHKEDGSIKTGEIKSRIQKMRAKHKAKYPMFNPKLKLINYSTILSFSTSYITMCTQLDLRKS